MWVWDPETVRPGSIGDAFLSGFAFDRQKWRGGKVRSPEDGRTYGGEIWLDADVLRLKGCAGIFCQSQAWRRLADIPRPVGTWQASNGVSGPGSTSASIGEVPLDRQGGQ